MQLVLRCNTFGHAGKYSFVVLDFNAHVIRTIQTYIIGIFDENNIISDIDDGVLFVIPSSLVNCTVGINFVPPLHIQIAIIRPAFMRILDFLT